jgi:asparagine synthase (glutamine-hydrolysing)
MLDRFPFGMVARAVRPLVRAVREEKGGHYRINHMKRFLDGFGLPPAQRWQGYHALFTQSERRLLYRPHVAREVDFEAVDLAGRQYYERFDSPAPLDRALYQDIKMYLPDDILALTDRIGMWHSLELRVPFVDHTLVEFCARIPASMKVRGTEKKHLLREAARPYLPASVLGHRKQGFASPLAMWLRGDMRGFVESRLGRDAVGSHGVLNPAQVEATVAAHQERRRLNDKQIFAMLVFQSWFRGPAT